MIGAAKSMMAGSEIIALNYRVELNPSNIDVFSVNGSETSPTVFSTVLDGVGPFTYLWTIDNSKINIVTPTNANTQFQTSGNNEEITGDGLLTVTDTGNANEETSQAISVIFEFEP